MKRCTTFTKAAKEPLSYVGNSVGLRRRGFQQKKIRNTRYLPYFYIKKLQYYQALGIIEAEMEATPERRNYRLYPKLIERSYERIYR
jgi:UDP-N-acetylglucosamine acyltransferase